jgi:hypothetical protein
MSFAFIQFFYPINIISNTSIFGLWVNEHANGKIQMCYAELKKYMIIKHFIKMWRFFNRVYFLVKYLLLNFQHFLTDP